ncbi:hypothetical protein UA08_08488 [Talaromyces atroroseus]|uniref:SnoaL-like domain-containing protein n=1 Tax=Talaromyces atroroseus TaxID=1441469 RepID=A0A1Q5Q7S0_TALAT|nr:hypothetical protein UA08_08488 [Talaromyces atroroseus]OKL56270.1 hypothetical protein UA08_08488 [Talaromyces atroroseus]
MMIKRTTLRTMLVLAHQCYAPSKDKTTAKDNVLSTLMKWAEEGYTVVEITESAFSASAKEVIDIAVEALRSCDKCKPQETFGVAAYDPQLWNRIAPATILRTDIAGVIVYSEIRHYESIAPTGTIPGIYHLAGKASFKPPRPEAHTAYVYPAVTTHLFASPHQPEFHYSSESVSHTRNLTFLKRRMNGPYFDLEAIWDEHTYYEFENRSLENTMAPMVQEPYVNHIPTMIGGIGRLTYFYANHFIFANPDNTELELISQTIGIDRVVDEFIYKFTHEKRVDWLLPGVPPTGKYVQIPMTAVVNIRGDRLYHEHIAWDQGSVLVQCRLMPEYLPFSQPGANGEQMEYRVPVAGVETAEKMRVKDSVESNGIWPAMAPTLFSIFALSCTAAATLNLNISGPSWDYTANDLADTTSLVCKNAYSASIDCDDTLLKIVASLDPDFDPQSADLEAMCTTACSDSLAQYVKDVNAACNQPGDLANVASGNKGIPQASVATVGEVFQYKYGEACAMNGSDYCFLTYPDSSDWARIGFPCNDTCAVQFYQNAHDQPGSAYWFDYFYLSNQSSYWENTFAGGWQTVVQCGDGGSDVSVSSASVSATAAASDRSALSTDAEVSLSATTAIWTAAAAATTSAETTALTAGSTIGSSAIAATASRATSGAARLMLPFVGFF